MNNPIEVSDLFFRGILRILRTIAKSYWNLDNPCGNFEANNKKAFSRSLALFVFQVSRLATAFSQYNFTQVVNHKSYSKFSA